MSDTITGQAAGDGAPVEGGQSEGLNTATDGQAAAPAAPAANPEPAPAGADAQALTQELTNTRSALEQQRRIGILRAVGARRVDILIIFLFEAALIGALGSALGLTLAHAGLWMFGSRLSAGLAAGGTPVSDLFHLPILVDAAILALGVVLSLLAGIVPAMKAAWIRPIEVLKH